MKGGPSLLTFLKWVLGMFIGKRHFKSLQDPPSPCILLRIHWIAVEKLWKIQHQHPVGTSRGPFSLGVSTRFLFLLPSLLFTFIIFRIEQKCIFLNINSVYAIPLRYLPSYRGLNGASAIEFYQLPVLASF